MCVYVCMYVYIYIYICIYTIHMYMCIRIYTLPKQVTVYISRKLNPEETSRQSTHYTIYAIPGVTLIYDVSL